MQSQVEALRMVMRSTMAGWIECSEFLVPIAYEPWVDKYLNEEGFWRCQTCNSPFEVSQQQTFKERPVVFILPVNSTGTQLDVQLSSTHLPLPICKAEARDQVRHPPATHIPVEISTRSRNQGSNCSHSTSNFSPRQRLLGSGVVWLWSCGASFSTAASPTWEFRRRRFRNCTGSTKLVRRRSAKTNSRQVWRYPIITWKSRHVEDSWVTVLTIV